MVVNHNMNRETKIYNNQISEANKLGNALLSGLISDGISESKKSVKIVGSLKNLNELIEGYKNEVGKLKSLQIGSCSEVIDMKQKNMCQVQIGVAGTLLQKIDKILKLHVKHNASTVVSGEDLKELRNQLGLMKSMKEQLERLPKVREDLMEHLTIVNAIQACLEQITGSVETSSSMVATHQDEAISDSSDVLYLFD